jgi:hypothetical protein
MLRAERKKLLKNEKGIALATVLILSVIVLAVVSTLVYLTLQGTQFSGFLKRYETAREAGIGGAEIAGALIKNHGSLIIPSGVAGGYLVNLTNACDCGDPDNMDDNRDSTGHRTCLCDKICNPPSGWATACTVSDSIPPVSPSGDATNFLNPIISPDVGPFTLSGIGGASYQVSIKIVDTVRGNSDLSTEQLGGTSVSASNSSSISAPPLPYLYRLEINSQEAGVTDMATFNARITQRSRLSVLYAY